MKASFTLVVLLVFAFSDAVVVQRAVKNDGAKPFAVFDVVYKQGKTAAVLYLMPGETMTFDSSGVQNSGAGYYEAVRGDYFYLQNKRDQKSPSGRPIMFEGHVTFCTIHVDRISWDHSGRLTAISGIRPDGKLTGPAADAKAADTEVTSDVKNPKIANGNLYITLAGHGATEYWLKVQFGFVVAIGKTGDSEEIGRGFPLGAVGPRGSRIPRRASDAIRRKETCGEIDRNNSRPARAGPDWLLAEEISGNRSHWKRVGGIAPGLVGCSEVIDISPMLAAVSWPNRSNSNRCSPETAISEVYVRRASARLDRRFYRKAFRLARCWAPASRLAYPDTRR
jgi:hypothetical protein